MASVDTTNVKKEEVQDADYKADDTKQDETEHDELLQKIHDKFHAILHDRLKDVNAESLAQSFAQQDEKADGDDEKVSENNLKEVASDIEKEFLELLAKWKSINPLKRHFIKKKLNDALAKFLKDKFGWEIPTNPDEFQDIFVPATLEKRQEPNQFVEVEPNDYNDLKQTMINLFKEIGVKAIGTEYGWTNIAFSNGTSINMPKNINRPSVAINKDILNDYGLSVYNKGNVIQTEAGCSYYDLAAHIWPTNKRRTLYKDEEKGEKYKVFKFIGFDKLALGGSISCGCQGWGTWFNKEGGSIPNGVRSIHLITYKENGELKEYIIECSVDNKDNPPIFDKEKWPYDVNNFELIQDDNIFNCALVSVGSYGIIYSYYFELQDAFFIKEVKYVTTFEDFKKVQYPKIIAEMKDGKISSWELWVSPYKVKLPFSKFNDSPPILITVDYFETDPNAKPPRVINKDNGGGLRGSPWMSVMGGILQIIVTKFIPTFAPLILQVFINDLTHENPIVLTPMDGASFWSGNDIANQTCGFGIPHQHFWNALSDWMKLMNEITDKKKHYIANGGTFIRFTVKSRGFLSMYTNANDEGAFMVEQSTVDFSNAAKPWNIFGSSPGWQFIFKSTQNLLMDKYEASTHWGLYFTTDIKGGIFKGINQQKMKLFVENYQRFNVAKKFCNQFTVQSGLDKMAGFV